MRAEYGDVMVMPAMFGRPETVMAFGAQDIEKVKLLSHQRVNET